MGIALPDPALHQMLQEAFPFSFWCRHFLPWYPQSTLIIFLTLYLDLPALNTVIDLYFPGLGNLLMQFLTFHVVVLLAVLSLDAQSCPTLCDPMDCSPPGPLCLWGFYRQEYWSGLPCPPSGDLHNPGIEPRSPALQVDSLPTEPPGPVESLLTFPLQPGGLQSMGLQSRTQLSD